MSGWATKQLLKESYFLLWWLEERQSRKIEIDSWEWIRQKDESYCDENIDGKHSAEYDYDYDYDYYDDGDDEAEMKHGGVVLPNCGWNDRSPVRTASV